MVKGPCSTRSLGDGQRSLRRLGLSRSNPGRRGTGCSCSAKQRGFSLVDHVLAKLGEAGAGPLPPPVLRWFPYGLSPEQNQHGQDGRFPLPSGFSLPVLEQEEQAPSVH